MQKVRVFILNNNAERFPLRKYILFKKSIIIILHSLDRHEYKYQYQNQYNI